VPGTASNLPRPAPRPSSSTGGSRETENRNYETSRIVRHSRTAQGGLKRLSASVLVDQVVRWEGPANQPTRVLVPPTPDQLKRINDVVAAAIDIRPERGDRLVVETLPFENTLALEPPPAPVAPPTFLENLKSDRFVISTLAICAVVLILGLAAFRRIPKPAPVVTIASSIQAAVPAPFVDSAPPPPPTAVPAFPAATLVKELGNTLEEELRKREKDSLEQLRVGGSALQALTQEVVDMAGTDPTLCANVLRTWMTENQTTS